MSSLALWSSRTCPLDRFRRRTPQRFGTHELLWDLTHSAVVSEEMRARLLTKLAARLDAAGMVRVVASDRRSQSQNRDAAASRLTALVRQALVVPRPRRATRPTKASREQRLADKRKRAERKRDRRRDGDD